MSFNNAPLFQISMASVLDGTALVRLKGFCPHIIQVHKYFILFKLKKSE